MSFCNGQNNSSSYRKLEGIFQRLTIPTHKSKRIVNLHGRLLALQVLQPTTEPQLVSNKVKEGDLVGLIFGMPPKLTDSEAGIEDEDTSLLLEAQYRIPLSDHIMIIPGFFSQDLILLSMTFFMVSPCCSLGIDDQIIEHGVHFTQAFCSFLFWN